MRRVTLLTNPDRCNLHCPLCFLNQRNVPMGLGNMPYDVARSAIEKYATDRDASGRRLLREVIPSTMGEPLLYTEFGKLLEFCSALDLPLNLTTNGTFPGEWGTDAGMVKLLRSCNDIKVSTLSFETGGLDAEIWRGNLLRLLKCRGALEQAESGCEDGRGLVSVSLQVTLHRENLKSAERLLRWAEEVGICRIKWNPVVFLKNAPLALRDRFAVNSAELDVLRSLLQSDKVRCQGSLFFKDPEKRCAVGGLCGASCPFADEVWVWPDGHEDHCPNPERRFGG